MMTIQEYAEKHDRSNYEMRQVLSVSSEPSQIRHTAETWGQIFNAYLQQVTDHSATNAGVKKHMVDGRQVCG